MVIILNFHEGSLGKKRLPGRVSRDNDYQRKLSAGAVAMHDALEHGLRPFRASHETQADFVAIHVAPEHGLRPRVRGSGDVGNFPTSF